MTSGHQRFGHVISLAEPDGAKESSRRYWVRDDETSDLYWFDDQDIVTEGFRSARTGERVRFLPGAAGHASYVIRLELPDPEDYYS
jgi:hypothetical protein